MSEEMNRYLKNVKLWMFGMSRKTVKGIIQELQNHIVESAHAMGGPSTVDTVVSGMLPPRKMAKMYKQIYGYGMLFKVIFIIIIIFLSIWTVPIWEVANPNFSTNFVFLILIFVLFFVGSKAGIRMALVAGFSAFITRFIILGLIAAIAGEHGIIQGGAMFAFLLASALLILVAFLPEEQSRSGRREKHWNYHYPNCMRLTPAQGVKL